MTDHISRIFVFRFAAGALLAYLLLAPVPAGAVDPARPKSPPSGTSARPPSKPSATATTPKPKSRYANPSKNDWSWELPPERYQEMSMFERGQYDKAVDLMKKGAFRAASTEFEKFQTQFSESKFIPHVLFMRAYSMHQNKTRGEAIKLYNEVMDYFGQSVDDAAPALYFMGVAHIENGDIKEGLKCMQEMIDDEDYSGHPLAAGALCAVADNCWRNKEREKAVKYWRLAFDFWKCNQTDATRACNSATAYYIKTRNYQGYEEWLVNSKNADDLKHRIWVGQNAWNVAWNGFLNDFGGEYTAYNQKDKAEAMKAFWTWFKTQRQWYEKNKDPWLFYDRSINFLTQRWGEKEECNKFIEEALAYIKTLNDKADADKKLSWICDRLCNAGASDRAIYIADQISDRPAAEYKKYEIYAGLKDWEKALARLKDIETMPGDKWKIQAMNERARLYKDVLGRYEEAVKLYQTINKPPDTLWAIQDCYKRWGKLNEALQQLTEIENSFPDQASQAAWHKAAYLEEAGDKEKAIAQGRRIMKVYPKTDASSKAHQLLERLGVKTGGGVADGAAGDVN